MIEQQTMLARPGRFGPTRSQMKTHSRVDAQTQGQIEAAVCAIIRQFELDQMGRGPRDIRAHLLGDLLVVRLTGVLTPVEKHLAQSHPAAKSRDLLKQVRNHLVETARPILGALILEATGVNVLSMHQDISTVTGEELIVFTLSEAPSYRGRNR